jgi:hypothetical protein
VTLTAANGTLPNATQSFTLTVNPSPVAPVITSVNNTTAVNGTGSIFQVTATGTAPLTYSLTSAPSGVTINSTSGLMTIASTIAANTYTFTVTASNSVSPVNQTFKLTVNVPVILVSNTPELRNALLSGTADRIIRLQNDIDATENNYNWVAIPVTNDNFILDGNGKTLTIKSYNSYPCNCINSPCNNPQCTALAQQPNDMEAGLLGRATNSTVTIKKLGVVGSAVVESEFVSSGVPAYIRAGGLAALVEGGSFTVEETYFMNINEGVRAARNRNSSSAETSAGGFFGQVTNATVKINNCCVNADINADARADGAGNPTSHAGGFVGLVYGNNTSLTITRSYAAGTVNAFAHTNNTSATVTPFAGGLIGRVVTAPRSYY